MPSGLSAGRQGNPRICEMISALKRIFAKRQVVPVPNTPTETSSRGFWIGGSDSGAFVSTDSALGIPAVWSCVHLISNAISMLPWGVLAASSDPEDGFLPLPGHPVAWLLDREPNPEMTASRFRN